MTVIFTAGDFWIESVIFPTITTTNAEEFVDSTQVLLTRPGRVVGWAISTRNGTDPSNLAALGALFLFDQSSLVLSYGNSITSVLARIFKAASTNGGTFLLEAVLFMRE